MGTLALSNPVQDTIDVFCEQGSAPLELNQWLQSILEVCATANVSLGERRLQRRDGATAPARPTTDALLRVTISLSSYWNP